MTPKPIIFSAESVRAILDGRKTQTRRVVKEAGPEWELLGVDDHAVITGVYRNGDEYPLLVDGTWAGFRDESDNAPLDFPMVKSRVQPGDVLWVRETWCGDEHGYYYKADTKCRYAGKTPYPDGECDDDNCGIYEECERTNGNIKWRSPIHMPRAAARLFLRVTDVRVERLHDGFTKPTSPIFSLLEEGIDIGDHCRECIDSYGNPCCAEWLDEGGAWNDECGLLDDIRTAYANLWDSLNAKRGYPWKSNPYVWVIGFGRCENGNL